ncbi:alpha/beta hydrolase [Pedococcus aerophilus]|uniref:Alpha/beta hydrolase n=1 Tax=Pedococcus aerophilus TaxID=436356 RepID=A0ABN3UQU7_9MICO
MATTHHLATPDVTLVYDVHGALPTADGRPPLFMVGAPMGAEGFTTLVGLFADRTVITYDVRGIGRSERSDGSLVQTPEQNAADHHAVISALGAGPVEMFASSGGAVSALALIAAHPEDVTTVVAHEPPLLAVLPDADAAFAAERAVHAAYQERGQGAGMAAFIGLTSWSGEFTPEYAAQPAPDPAQFGMSAEDDGSRDDPLLSGVSDAITAYRPDLDALRSATTRVVLAAGIESAGTITDRSTQALAELLGQEVVVFPSHHGGFMGGEHGYGGQPEAFAAKLREVLGS